MRGIRFIFGLINGGAPSSPLLPRRLLSIETLNTRGRMGDFGPNVAEKFTITQVVKEKREKGSFSSCPALSTGTARRGFIKHNCSDYKWRMGLL